MTDAQGKAEAFQASRQFWKFEVEGWDRPLSLKEVEQAIKDKSAEKLKLYNFLRPAVRETIQGQIDYLNEVKRDVQKQLAAKELSIGKGLGAADVRYQITSREVEQTQKVRAEQGRQMPAPVNQGEELIRIDAVASRNKDASLLQYVYAQTREKVLNNPSPQSLSRVRGRAIMARIDMLEEAERLNAALQYGDFRQISLKYAQGLDYTKSLREVSPKNALETIIRFFTDSQEQKREQRELTDAVRWQQERAEDRANKAKDFSYVMDRILGDHCRAAGVSPDKVTPMLSEQQIAEVRDFAERMPYVSRIRRDFNDAANQAERGLDERAAAAARESQQMPTHDRPAAPAEQGLSQQTPTFDRSYRDAPSCGR